MRILGIDYGGKRVGVAVSDEAAEFAFPLEVLTNDKNIFNKLKKICLEKEIKKIILGLPLDFKNEPTHATQGAEKFKMKLEKELGLPVIFENETLTTKQAERLPEKKRRFDSLRIRRPKVQPKTDASAAALILKTYLERKKAV
ncbi:MAG: Holliday junction resolvase RuvX [Patescibacteria group bacterium]